MLLIIGDEITIREGMRDCVDWQTMGVAHALTATNAWSKIRCECTSQSIFYA
ncbi:MAG: hypothetical protein RR482_04355 [Clostridia bacterium]